MQSGNVSKNKNNSNNNNNNNNSYQRGNSNETDAQRQDQKSPDSSGAHSTGSASITLDAQTFEALVKRIRDDVLQSITPSAPSPLRGPESGTAPVAASTSISNSTSTTTSTSTGTTVIAILNEKGVENNTVAAGANDKSKTDVQNSTASAMYTGDDKGSNDDREDSRECPSRGDRGALGCSSITDASARGCPGINSHRDTTSLSAAGSLCSSSSSSSSVENQPQNGNSIKTTCGGCDPSCLLAHGLMEKEGGIDAVAAGLNSNSAIHNNTANAPVLASGAAPAVDNPSNTAIAATNAGNNSNNNGASNTNIIAASVNNANEKSVSQPSSTSSSLPALSSSSSTASAPSSRQSPSPISLVSLNKFDWLKNAIYISRHEQEASLYIRGIVFFF